MKNLLLLLLGLTLLACTTEETNINQRQQKTYAYIDPEIGVETLLPLQTKPDYTEYKKITIICKEYTTGGWKGVGKDESGYYYDLESKQENIIVSGKIETRQVITAKFSKLQYPWTPDC